MSSGGDIKPLVSEDLHGLNRLCFLQVLHCVHGNPLRGKQKKNISDNDDKMETNTYSGHFLLVFKIEVMTIPLGWSVHMCEK